MAGRIDFRADHDRQPYDRNKMIKAFDETEAGVKGLIDSGLLLKVPKIFLRPSGDLAEESAQKNTGIDQEVPLIDLSEIKSAHRRNQAVEQIRVASESWGFFQVVNHGIPLAVLDGMIDGVRKFNEQDLAEKRTYYSRDVKRRVKFHSNYDLFSSRIANWRDTLSILFPDQIHSNELPASCRESTVEYCNHVSVLGYTLLELLSEALGLKPHHLKNMDCSKGHRLSCHYYPPCPEPELAIGATKHSDPGFLTILLQNQINGLQVLYQDQWVDVETAPGCLVINIGDLLQLVSNGKFISNKHRVIANSVGPRISVACFLFGPVGEVKVYGPIKELISEENRAEYREVVLRDYVKKFLSTGLDDQEIGLDYYKL